ncbi:unnamed protein product, partial [Pneumocystis jirovecii]
MWGKSGVGAECADNDMAQQTAATHPGNTCYLHREHATLC